MFVADGSGLQKKSQLTKINFLELRPKHDKESAEKKDNMQVKGFEKRPLTNLALGFFITLRSTRMPILPTSFHLCHKKGIGPINVIPLYPLISNFT